MVHPDTAAVGLTAAPPTPLTFRHFVTGPQNALAYNAALTVARTPGTAYNPLFLCGGPGLGKTHLLHAIQAYLAPRLRGREVLLVSGESFAQDFAAHLRRGHMLPFRLRYRRAGAFLIDDVGALAGRETAAEELVRTLDTLRDGNRQLVIADEQRPGAIRGLPERLRARLLCSVVATLQLPDQETRLAILRRLAAHWGLVVPDGSPPADGEQAGQAGQAGRGVTDDALTVLAGRIRGPAPDLAEALARLTAAIAGGTGGSLGTAALAARVACELNREACRPRGRARIDGVIGAVCGYYGIPRPVLLGKSREMTVAQARQVAMYLLREDAGLTAAQAGIELGRDHSTVLHGHARIAGALDNGDTLMTGVLDGIRKSAIRGAGAPGPGGLA